MSKLQDGIGRTLNSAAGALSVTPIFHQLADDGRLHTLNYSASVADEGTLDILIQPADRPLFIFPFVYTGAACSAMLVQNPEIEPDGEGTAIVAIGQNRISPVGYTASFYHTPTITDMGEFYLFSGYYLPAGVRSDLGFGGGWLLIPNYPFILRISNDSGGASDVNITIQFYEV